jgi:hypothetical protein
MYWCLIYSYMFRHFKMPSSGSPIGTCWDVPNVVKSRKGWELYIVRDCVKVGIISPHPPVIINVPYWDIYYRQRIIWTTDCNVTQHIYLYWHLCLPVSHDLIFLNLTAGSVWQLTGLIVFRSFVINNAFVALCVTWLRYQRSLKRVRFWGLMLTGGKTETCGERPLLVPFRPPQIPHERISYKENKYESTEQATNFYTKCKFCLTLPVELR